jgi:hypothetical protein
MSSRHRRTTARSNRRRLAVTVLGLVAALAALVGLQVPGAYGGFIASLNNGSNTAGTRPFFTCAAADQAVTRPTAVPTASFAYPLNDSAGTAAADVSGNAATGLYTSTGVTYGSTTGPCTRDTTNTAVTLNGSSGGVSGPATAIAPPAAFTTEVWFRTSTAGGLLIGFGNTRTGNDNLYDRHLFLDSSGHVAFGVASGTLILLQHTITSPATYLDNKWHLAAATLSPSGMALYVDGVLAGTDPTNTAQNNYASGYWRIGYGNLFGWGSSSNYFTGQLAYAAAWNATALTASQIAAQYAAAS